MKQLALVVHFHQPVGNLDRVVRNATDRCYRPFLEILEDHPAVPMTLHYSGCLLEWLEANASDVVEKIVALVERGQVELMTGGFYEPILAAIPSRDRVGQIRMMSDHLAATYGADAAGLWLTERVWEQDVIPALLDAGVRYTVLDDTIFHSVGITDDDLKGPFVTEHDGRPLLVYAGDRRLRYLIPYKRVQRVLDRIGEADDDRLLVYADDGEKFGEWPDTYERVYGADWLESFFEGLVQGTIDVSLTTLGAHALEAQPEGRVYLPSSSYDEMMTWALPAEARLTVGGARRRLARDDPEGLLPFVRGAPWRAFMAKYPEVNQLQKRMLFVSDEVHAAGAPADAVRDLYRAQCNCAYWHGAFGGVYLSFMRAALWHHLMHAEAAVAREQDPRLVDLDADARNEVLIMGAWGAAVASTTDARLVELDDWTFGANVLAVAARHREAYHLAEENPVEDLEDDGDEMPAVQARADVDRDSLTFDEQPLGGCIDLIDGTRLDAAWKVTLDGPHVTFTAEVDSLRFEKRFTPMSAALVCQRRVTNVSRGSRAFDFASQTAVLPLNLGRDDQTTGVTLTDEGWVASQAEAEVELEVKCTPAATIGWTTIESASATLEGLMPMHQGVVVEARWAVDLEPGASIHIDEILVPRVRPDAGEKKEPGVTA
ncbi:MAG TPA: alpha-amylase/4-alpha-glucanotransferase domain-containing protein [Actinomycetota bacterium]|nr:alpha-amylase/4-alpha-glucanotransferase domain-containing protein [Actinomycetota bacterium]